MPKKQPYLSSNTKKVIWAVSLVGTISGAIIGVNNAYPVIEPHFLASRLFVRDAASGVQRAIKVEQDNTNYILRDIQIDQAKGKLDTTQQNIKRWTLELSKTKDQTTQELINKDIGDLSEDAKALKKQIQTLERMRGLAH